MLPPNPDRIYESVDEFAWRNGISQRHVRRMVDAGRLPAVRLGRRILIPNDALDALLSNEGEQS